MPLENLTPLIFLDIMCLVPWCACSVLSASFIFLTPVGVMAFRTWRSFRLVLVMVLPLRLSMVMQIFLSCLWVPMMGVIFGNCALASRQLIMTFHDVPFLMLGFPCSQGAAALASMPLPCWSVYHSQSLSPEANPFHFFLLRFALLTILHYPPMHI